MDVQVKMYMITTSSDMFIFIYLQSDFHKPCVQGWKISYFPEQTVY